MWNAKTVGLPIREGCYTKKPWEILILKEFPNELKKASTAVLVEAVKYSQGVCDLFNLITTMEITMHMIKIMFGGSST